MHAIYRLDFRGVPDAIAIEIVQLEETLEVKRLYMMLRGHMSLSILGCVTRGRFM